MEFIQKLFNTLFGLTTTTKSNDDQSKVKDQEKINNFAQCLRKKNNKAKSYLFEQKTLTFYDQFCFDLRYLYKDELWLMGKDLAEGVGFQNGTSAIRRCVERHNVKTVDQIIFKRHNDENVETMLSSDIVDNMPPLYSLLINKDGALQLLEHIDFDNKLEFVSCLRETFNDLELGFNDGNKVVAPPPSPTLEHKFNQLLQAIEKISVTNETLLSGADNLNNQFYGFEQKLERQIEELNDKIRNYDNIEELYNKLMKYQKAISPQSLCSNLSFLSETNVTSQQFNVDTSMQYQTVKFPKNPAKFPRLVVFLKSNKSNNGSTMVFLCGQQKSICSRKRKYEDMEIVYDSVHPNPLMAIHCIDEELSNKNYNYVKQNKRKYQLDMSVDAAKSFINENV
ncbi:38.7K [Ectropis obliqua nucleopolyhedrovirus]|uniref:38.7K n=1 Tax=Ectropis obliqua nucleopolyhedrovirus TaxID=59376 RepID=Q77SA8_9ABAC|nr:38.7K [Ectropis obliqua nucleopolyhedrovirus]AAQ88176.1 38.7K [Ectropis obliqua nucleopolyhedrovirus]AGS47866.1 putative 38.7 kDa protein [Ectropis obliqua nucleopolyhedrovirus]QWV59713.1 38.7K [Ectropis obliqua nucleopolyhedrovirus]UYO72921.1 38.7K [Ectropis obliqua nucleopolyhedrovirus]